MVSSNRKHESGSAVAGSKTSAVQTVVDTILSRIREGYLIPGQHIIAQDIMDELGLSKAPVREAIHILVGEGVMELVQNRSAKVRNMTRRDLIAFTEVWSAVGGVNVRLGAKHIHENGNKERAEKLLKNIVKTEKNRVPLEFFTAVTEFHTALTEMSGNNYIRDIITRAHFSYFHRHIMLTFPGHHWRRHISAFEKLGKAVLEADGDAAERHYRKHMRWVVKHLQSETK